MSYGTDQSGGYSPQQTGQNDAYYGRNSLPGASNDYSNAYAAEQQRQAEQRRQQEQYWEQQRQQQR